MTTVATAARGTPPHAPLGKPASALPPPVIGKPCQHCGQRVQARALCSRCKTNLRPEGRKFCDECRKPKSETRFCVKCGTRFEYVRGAKGARRGGTDGFRCPSHRKAKA